MSTPTMMLAGHACPYCRGTVEGVEHECPATHTRYVVAGRTFPPAPKLSCYGHRSRYGPYTRQAARWVGRGLEWIGGHLQTWSWSW